MLSPDPDLVVKSEAVSEQLLGRLQSYSNYPPVVTAVPGEGAEADGSTHTSPRSANSIWSGLSIVSLSNPTNRPCHPRRSLRLRSALHTQMC